MKRNNYLAVHTYLSEEAKETITRKPDGRPDHFTQSWSPTIDQVQPQAGSFDLSVTYTDNLDKISAAAVSTVKPNLAASA